MEASAANGSAARPYPYCFRRSSRSPTPSRPRRPLVGDTGRGHIEELVGPNDEDADEDPPQTAHATPSRRLGRRAYAASLLRSCTFLRLRPV